jgi:hypothetical protein
MPAVFDPDVDPDFPNIHGRPVARFAFTVHHLVDQIDADLKSQERTLRQMEEMLGPSPRA